MAKKSKDADKIGQSIKNPNFVPGWFGGRLTTPAAQKRAATDMSTMFKARVIANAEARHLAGHNGESSNSLKM